MIRLAAAQSGSVPADIDANVRIHLRFIEAARHAHVDVLLFPELSLCGYELAHLAQLALRPDDERLAPIRARASAAGMTIIVGAGVPAEGGVNPSIGAFIFTPDGATSTYRKQYLHPGEERHASAGPRGPFIRDLHGTASALAICADSSHEAHAADAAAAGAALYLASVLISRNGFAVDSEKMRGYAKSYGLGVLMTNHCAPSGGYDAAGRSSFWAPGGELVIAAAGTGDCLVLAEQKGTRWRGAVLTVAAD